MNKNTKGIVTIAVIAGIGFGGYQYFFNSKRAYAKTISKYTGIGFMQYMTFDKDYLKARAKALKSGSDTFTLNGKTYNSDSGKSATASASAFVPDKNSSPINTKPVYASIPQTGNYGFRF